MAEGLVGIPGFNLSQITDIGGKIGLIVVIGVVIMLLIMVIRYFVLFNVSAELYNDPGGRILKKTNMKLNFKKKIVESLKFKELFYPYPETDKIYFEGKRMHLKGRVINNCVSWMSVSVNPGFKPASIEWQDALSYRLQKNSELTTERGFWDKYKEAIIIMAGYAALIIIAILVTQQMGKLIEVNQDMARQAAVANTQQLSLIGAGLLSTWKPKKGRN